METFQDEHTISDEEQSLAEHEEQLQEILLAYRQQKMREHMAGPLVSFVLHIVLLTLLTVFVVGKERPDPLPEIEVMMEEIPIKEIEPPDPIVRNWATRVGSDRLTYRQKTNQSILNKERSRC